MKRKLFIFAALIVVGSAAFLFLVASPNVATNGANDQFVRQRGGRFFVETPGADGAPAEFEVKYTFGVDPLQQYLVELPGGRLQPLPVAWDVAARRWFPLEAGERAAPGDPFHWTGRYQSWNAVCAECHSTDLRKNYDAQADRYATDWAEIVGLYDVLLRLEPSPVVELNRAVAVAMRDGLAAGLTAVDAILARGELADYHLAHAVRADLCRRLGRSDEAVPP